MEILDGKFTAAALKSEVKAELELAYKTTKQRCSLAIIRVGEDPASKVYVKNKLKAAEEVGIAAKLYLLNETATQSELETLIKNLAKDDNVHGILLQLPLPKHLDSDRATELVPPEKDVDGFTTASLGRLVIGEKSMVSCTPGGIIYLLKKYGVELKGKNAVVVGRSKIVGKPMALLLINNDCTVTVCHSKTADLKSVCLNADLLIAAIGKPKFITGDMVKEGAVVVDVGINRTETGLVGDVDFEQASKKASLITPVPGGVGPMTVAYLMKNTATAFFNALKK